ncbi:MULTISPECIES: DUF1799 domain-containing protein [Gammaproteobacteria]|uniref:DUF1799 domain-containing protein n=1 Tax=Gammaproteobacteria TaxID=1236 RepID=UPI002FCBAC66
MTQEDYDNEEPEVVDFDYSMGKAWDVFLAMGTQWRSSGAGAYGLDYNVLPMMFRIYKIDDEELALSDIRVLESRALSIMSKR